MFVDYCRLLWILSDLFIVLTAFACAFSIFLRFGGLGKMCKVCLSLVVQFSFWASFWYVVFLFFGGTVPKKSTSWSPLYTPPAHPFLEIGNFAWEFSRRNFHLGTVALDLSLRMVARELSLDEYRLRSFVLEVPFGCFAWDLSLGSFRVRFTSTVFPLGAFTSGFHPGMSLLEHFSLGIFA